MKTRLSIVLVGLLITGLAAEARAQTVAVTLNFDGTTLSPADASRPELREGTTLAIVIEGNTLPTGFESAWTFSLDGAPLARATGPLRAGAGAGYSIQVEETTDPAYTLEFADANGNVTMGELQFPAGDAPPGLGDLAAVTASDVCGRSQVYDRKRNEALLVFTENGLPFDRLPRDLDDNDVIHICLSIPQGADPGSFSVQVQGTIKDQEINVLGQGALGDLRGVTQSTAPDRRLHLYGSYGPFSSPSITVTIGRTAADEDSRRSHVLRINTTYVANLQFGVGVANIRFNDFAIAPLPDAEPGTMGIRNRKGEDEEARELLLIGFYGWPWQDDFWNGRDVEETPDFGGRFGPMLGLGLDDVPEEFLAGVTFEIAKGLFVFGALHFASTTQLQEGFSEGEPLSIELESVPTTEEWKSDAIWGFSADLRIAAGVLKGILGSG